MLLCNNKKRPLNKQPARVLVSVIVTKHPLLKWRRLAVYVFFSSFPQLLPSYKVVCSLLLAHMCNKILTSCPPLSLSLCLLSRYPQLKTTWTGNVIFFGEGIKLHGVRRQKCSSLLTAPPALLCFVVMHVMRKKGDGIPDRQRTDGQTDCSEILQ